MLQLFRVTQTIIHTFDIKEGPKVFETEIAGKPWSMYNDTVIGFDQNGKEVVRTTVEEPFYVRSNEHTNAI